MLDRWLSRLPVIAGICFPEKEEEEKVSSGYSLADNLFASASPTFNFAKDRVADVLVVAFVDQRRFSPRLFPPFSLSLSSAPPRLLYFLPGRVCSQQYLNKLSDQVTRPRNRRPPAPDGTFAHYIDACLRESPPQCVRAIAIFYSYPG